MKRSILSALFLITLVACNKEREVYYERPDWLQGPLYEQIKSTGQYEEFIDLVEYIGYDKFLSSRLTFTLFLPTNEAFQQYYDEMGVGSFREIDTLSLKQLIDYHLLQNSWDSVKMVNKTSWGYWGTLPQNFRTPSYYTPEIAVENGKNIYFENTFIHLYSTPFFQYFGYIPEDYNIFFKDSEYTGYNIDRGAIIDDQLGAENGFYYVIDKVLIPRSTADRVIEKHTDFEIFKSLLDVFVRYDYNASASLLNQNYDSLFTKVFSLNVDLADERITDSAPDGYYHVLATIFVPINQVIIDYFNENFPDYNGLENVPNIIIKYFVESHMLTDKKLFPSVLAKDLNETNDFSDEIDYEIGDGIISQEMSSNAIIYGVDRAINSNAFATVSGPIIKNPDYRIFTMMLELSGEIRTFFKPEIGHVVFVLNDALMSDMGFSYYEGDPVDFTDDRIFLDNDVMSNTEIKNFLQDYISITYKDLSASDEVFIKSKSNNYLKVTENLIEGVFGKANVFNQYEAINGSVIEVDTAMVVTSPYTIEDYLNDNRSDFSEFFLMLEKAGMLDAEGNISKLSLFSGVTVLLPTDEAIEAIKGTYIPAEDGSFDYRSLIQYQIISERTAFTDDNFPANDYGTDLFIAGVRIKISVGASDNVVTVIDNLSNIISIGPGPNSNILTSNGIIHVVDKVALY